MSKFLRKMKAMSLKPEDFRTSAIPFAITSLEQVQEPATTVVALSSTTVVSDSTTTVVSESLNTTADSSTTTVVVESPTTVAVGLWRAELNGALFPSSRIRRIVRAQDALTHAEESVYDFLWGPKNSNKDEYRLSRAGYDRIAKAARITKRNAALITERLIEKGFIQAESPADPLKRMGCEYRIFGYRAVLESLSKQGRDWVVKSGNGVLFVRPVTVVNGSPTTVAVGPLTTVVSGLPTTVVVAQPTTVVAEQPTTVVVDVPTTVVATTTLLDNKKDREERQTSSLTAVSVVCRKRGLAIDDDAERKIIRRCRDLDPNTTEDEIAYAVELKLSQLRNKRNVENLVGLLITSVPVYFEDPKTEINRYRAQKAEERAELERLARAVLEDQSSPPNDREWATAVLNRHEHRTGTR